MADPLWLGGFVHCRWDDCIYLGIVCRAVYNKTGRTLLIKHLIMTTVAAVLFVGCGPSRIEQDMFTNVQAGNIKAVKEYLDSGGNVNVQDEPFGCTPLHWAVTEDFKGSHRDMVELLIANGADVNAVDDMQKAPLHLASNRETAEILINAGANVNAKDHKVRTLLFSAVRGAANNHPNTAEMYLDLVKLLISNDVELDSKDTSGQTPLHELAASFDQSKASEICELLITNGANANVLNIAGRTPLDVAISDKRIKTAELLRRYDSKTAEELKHND